MVRRVVNGSFNGPGLALTSYNPILFGLDGVQSWLRLVWKGLEMLFEVLRCHVRLEKLSRFGKAG